MSTAKALISQTAARRPWLLGHILDPIAQTAPDSTALIVGAQRSHVTYAQLADLVAGQCEALRRSGLQAGDVVALQSTNSIAFVVGLLAAARANLVIAPLDPALPMVDRRARIEMVGARVVLTDTRRVSAGAAQPSDPEWFLESSLAGDDRAPWSVRVVVDPGAEPTEAVRVPGLTDRDALIMFTSGTTGTPKMVPWTHDNIAASVAGIVEAYGLTSADATVSVMPLFHGHGLIAALLATLTSGGRILLPAKGKFSAHTFFDDVAGAQATWYTAVPTIHQIVLDRAAEQGRTAGLRFVRSCSAPLPSAIAERLEALFAAPVLAAYGMTEATHQASSVRPGADQPTRLHTVGIPTSAMVRIVDGNGADGPANAIGEIWLKGPTVARGYLNNAAATAGGFVDGWLRTGDLGTLDRHGMLRVTGRIKELINRAGEKISPQHVEDVLMSHPDVAQAVVFGVPDPLYGERVAAAVVTRDGRHLTPADLMSYGHDRLSAFEIPETITFTDTLPLTPKGAVNRSKVADMFGRKVVLPA